MLVVDTNVLFGFFNADSVTKELIESSPWKLASPQEALDELRENKERICAMTKRKTEEFVDLLENLKQHVTFEQKETYAQKRSHADKITPHKVDTPFFALCLTHNCPLWSNDKKLKQQKEINVLSTADIIELLA